MRWCRGTTKLPKSRGTDCAALRGHNRLSPGASARFGPLCDSVAPFTLLAPFASERPHVIARHPFLADGSRVFESRRHLFEPNKLISNRRRAPGPYLSAV